MGNASEAKRSGSVQPYLIADSWTGKTPKERAAECRKIAAEYPDGCAEKEKILKQADDYEHTNKTK